MGSRGVGDDEEELLAVRRASVQILVFWVEVVFLYEDCCDGVSFVLLGYGLAVCE